MRSERKAAILAGILYFAGVVAGALSVVPVIDVPDYLVQISSNATQVAVGAFFQFLLTATYSNPK